MQKKDCQNKIKEKYTEIKNWMKSMNHPYLNFYAKHIQTQQYRGEHKIQQNRYTTKILLELIDSIYKIAKEDFFLKEGGDNPTTDSAEAEKFRIFRDILNDFLNKRVLSYSGKILSPTHKSISKQFYLELNRMGILIKEKYLKGSGWIHSDPYDRSPAQKRFKLSPVAIDIATTSNKIKQKMQLKRQLSGYVSEFAASVIELIFSENNNNNCLSLDEMQFVVLLSNALKNDDINPGEMLIKFRTISPNILDQFKTKLKELSVIVKNCKSLSKNDSLNFDFGNWRNQASSIINILEITNIFDLHKTNDKLYLNGKFIGDDIEPIKKRSIKAKNSYFSNHSIKKNTQVFQLHHYVSLRTATNIDEWKEIDDWKNLIYIDSNTHQLIHSFKDVHNKLQFIDNRLWLVDPNWNEYSGYPQKIELKNEKNSYWSIKCVPEMLEYNQNILEMLDKTYSNI